MATDDDGSGSALPRVIFGCVLSAIPAVIAGMLWGWMIGLAVLWIAAPVGVFLLLGRKR